MVFVTLETSNREYWSVSHKSTKLLEEPKDLALVEWAFRTSKTVQLEMRPIYVRLASRTRGHALVVMLAYRIIKELAQYWHAVDLTVAEGLKELDALCVTEIVLANGVRYYRIPQSRPLSQQLL